MINGVQKVQLVNNRFPESGIRAVEEAMDSHEFYNPYLRRAILATISKESGFKPKGEYSYRNTSNSRLRGLFGSRLSGLSESQLSSLKRNDVAFYDKIYGNRYGNTVYGDGYKYRGRGMNGLTFKGNYNKYGRLTNIDLVGHPELLDRIDVAAEVAVVFLKEQLNKIPNQSRFPVKDKNAFTDQATATYTVVSANAGWGKDVRRVHPQTLKNAEKNISIFQYPKELYTKFHKYGVKGITSSVTSDPTKFLQRNWFPLTLGLLAITSLTTLIVLNRKRI